MASDATGSRVELFDSALTVPSDSENYSANNESPSSPPSTSSSPMILYKPPTIWGLIRGAAINLLLPFVNGLMLGFGELFAHEAAFRLGWSNTKVCTDISWYTSSTNAYFLSPYPRSSQCIAEHIPWVLGWKSGSFLLSGGGFPLLLA